MPPLKIIAEVLLLSFFKDSMQEGTLSSLQLETICYACQRHQQLLPDKTRAGFFIGDGPGVGKVIALGQCFSVD